MEMFCLMPIFLVALNVITTFKKLDSDFLLHFVSF